MKLEKIWYVTSRCVLYSSRSPLFLCRSKVIWGQHLITVRKPCKRCICRREVWKDRFPISHLGVPFWVKKKSVVLCRVKVLVGERGQIVEVLWTWYLKTGLIWSMQFCAKSNKVMKPTALCGGQLSFVRWSCENLVKTISQRSQEKLMNRSHIWFAVASVQEAYLLCQWLKKKIAVNVSSP